jgi:uncharacterized protein YndB with AHSA1/START domain
MKVELTTRISITAQPHEVFKYLKDLRLHYLWNPQLQTITPLIELSHGQQYHATRMVLGQPLKVESTVKEFKPGKKLSLAITAGLVNSKVSWTLSPHKNGTLVICKTVVYNESPAFAFTKPVLRLLARRELQSDLQALKIAVENHLQ